MDLVSAFSSMQQASVLSKLEIAVAVRIAKTEQQAGAGVLQLLDAAEQGSGQAASNVGQAVQGLGAQVDVTA